MCVCVRERERVERKEGWGGEYVLKIVTSVSIIS